MLNPPLATEKRLAAVAPDFKTSSTWSHEATDVDGNMLFTKSESWHATRATWKAILVSPAGAVARLDRLPNIRAKRWTLTPSGVDIVNYGRY